MRDRHQLEELTGAVSLGLLAEQVVALTGLLVRRQIVAEAEREPLRIARDLLKALAETRTDVVVPSSGMHQMASADAVLDTFRAVRLQAPTEPTQTYLARLTHALDGALEGKQLEDEDLRAISLVQDLFRRLGQLTLTRAHDFFDRPREEVGPWTRLSSSSDF